MLRQVTTLAPINNHPPSLAFWLSNTTEFRHFLASDKHIHSYATEALVKNQMNNFRMSCKMLLSCHLFQAILSESVKTTFDQLVKVLQQELDLVIPHMMSEDSVTDHKSCAGMYCIALRCIQNGTRFKGQETYVYFQSCSLAKNHYS